MRIGVPRELKVHEYRVALTPAGVHELTRRGHDVLIERNAGVGCAFPDEAYLAAGAREDMASQTLVVVGAYLRDGRPGFILLAGHADAAAGVPGSAEELQDHARCPPPRGEWAK